jgi:hypothetical protein
VTWDDLVVLGPIFALKVVFTPAGFDRKVTAEMWFYPDGKRTLELSLKCLPGETMQAATEARLFFGDLGIDLLSAQETKTKNTLQFFAKERAERMAEAQANGQETSEGEATVAEAPTVDAGLAALAPADGEGPNSESADAMAELETNGTSA